MMGNEQFTRGMWEYFTHKRVEAMRILDGGAREKREGIPSQWQQESPFKQILKHARRNEDTWCISEIMRRSHLAKRDSRW